MQDKLSLTNIGYKTNDKMIITIWAVTLILFDFTSPSPMSSSKIFTNTVGISSGNMSYLLENGDSRFEIKEKIGRGAFGEVMLAIDKQTLSKVAIKRIPLQEAKGKLSKPVFREMESLRQLSESSLIVQLIAVYLSEGCLCLALEYLPIDLDVLISKTAQHFTPRQIKYVWYSLCQALAYCHSKNMIHRDIKPSNVLFSIHGELKLGDWGLARVCLPNLQNWTRERQMSHQVATRWYRPPELLFASRTYNLSMDVWSAGAVVAEVMSLRPLFPGNNDIDQMLKVFEVLGTPTLEDWPVCYLFMYYMYCFENN
jgi:serine/threonine protein kinase